MGNKVQPNAWVYNYLEEGDVKVGPSTNVTSKLPIANLSLYMLIDFSARHFLFQEKLLTNYKAH